MQDKNRTGDKYTIATRSSKASSFHEFESASCSLSVRISPNILNLWNNVVIVTKVVTEKNRTWVLLVKLKLQEERKTIKAALESIERKKETP